MIKRVLSAVICLICTLAVSNCALAATARGSGDDERVAKGFEHLLNFRVEEAMQSLCGPYIEAVNSGDNKKAARYLLLIASAFRYDDNEAAAAQCCKLAAKLDPDNTLALLMTAENLFRSGHVAEADTLWKKLESRPMNDQLVLRGRAVECLTRLHCKQAETFLQQAVQAGDSELPSKYRLARLYANAQSADEACRWYAACEEASLSTYQKKIYQGIVCQLKRDYKGAEAAFKAAGELNLNDPSWHDSLGMLYMTTRQPDLAREQFEQAVQCSRYSFLARIHYAAFFTYRGQAFKATKIIRKLVEQRPYSAATHHALGINYKTTGRVAEAEREFRQSIALNPRAEETFGALSQLDSIKKDKTRLRELINTWSTNIPESWGARSARASMLLEDKNWSQAREELLQADALRHEQKNTETRSIRICKLYSAVGTCYYEEGNLPKALEYAKLFNSIKPKPEEKAGVPIRPPSFDFAAHKSDSSEYKAAEHGVLADMLFEYSDLENAAKEYNEAISLDPRNIVWHGALLKVYLDKRDVVGAAREDAVVSQHMINKVGEALNFGNKKKQG